MSTGLNCVFISITGKNEHFYILQDWNCPKMAWDWMEYAKAYGPFESFEVALQHLDDNHANPGGFFRHEHVEGARAVIDRLIAEACERNAKAAGQRSPSLSLPSNWTFRY